jgi:hypothetical protein
VADLACLGVFDVQVVEHETTARFQRPRDVSDDRKMFGRIVEIAEAREQVEDVIETRRFRTGAACRGGRAKGADAVVATVVDVLDRRAVGEGGPAHHCIQSI